jgi:uncharacterized protein YqjF (DUF2071 family)
MTTETVSSAAATVPIPLLANTAHRPWPLPAAPWVMAQTWRDLLFAHWPLPAAALQALLPPALTVDAFDGQGWLGIVPFKMSGVRPRGLPAAPWLSAFPELNVRTYVRLRDRGIEKRGVYFFSLDAANPVAVQIARRTFWLPYFDAQMRAHNDGRTVHYASRRIHRGAAPADLAAGYMPTGAVYHAQPGDLDHWLTARYALYTVDRRGRPLHRRDSPRAVAAPARRRRVPDQHHGRRGCHPPAGERAAAPLCAQAGSRRLADPPGRTVTMHDAALRPSQLAPRPTLRLGFPSR